VRTISVAEVFAGTVHEAETCWYDTSAWPSWVDGLDHVEGTTGDWPRAGSSVTWRSGPAGRGRVIERVSGHEPLAGQTVEVQDDAISATQSLTFTPVDEGVEIRLSLEYAIKQRNPFTPLVDLLFIRRAMETSLRRTLSSFGAELAGRRSSARA
jgi:Polyketide cyclase / dehydrase and lipid transport